MLALDHVVGNAGVLARNQLGDAVTEDGAGYEEQPDRLFEHYPAADMNECAIFRESRVQGCKRVALSVDIAAEMGFERTGIFADLFLQAEYVNPGRQGADMRELS